MSKWEARKKISDREIVLEEARNPIVWHKDKWRWRDRHVPWRLSNFEYYQGSVEARRMRPPGWILTQMDMRWLKV